jgi:enoyl-[acyl-carrier protein] reductase II
MMRVIRTEAAENRARNSAVSAENRAQVADLDQVQTLYFDGDMAASVANTGQVASRITDLRPAAEIIDTMWRGCRDILTTTAGRV